MTNESDAIAREWVGIVRGEYLEMPDLRLTHSQARRLWGLDDGVCARVLTALVDDCFLRITGDGRYVRCAISGSEGRRRRVSPISGTAV
jgi:hypothetical protein